MIINNNKLDHSTNNNVSINMKDKLKKIIQLLFKQLKQGCYRKICYNCFCIKNPDFLDSYLYNKTKNISDKELLLLCCNMAKNEDNIQNYLCFDFKVLKYSSYVVENFDDWFSDFNINNKDVNSSTNSLLTKSDDNKFNLTNKSSNNMQIDISADIKESIIKEYNSIICTDNKNKNMDRKFCNYYLDPKIIIKKINCIDKNKNEISFDLFKEIQCFNNIFEEIINNILIIEQNIVVKKNNEFNYNINNDFKNNSYYNNIEYKDLLKQNYINSIDYVFKIYFNFINFCLFNDDFMYNLSYRKELELLLTNFNIILNLNKEVISTLKFNYDSNNNNNNSIINSEEPNNIFSICKNKILACNDIYKNYIFFNQQEFEKVVNLLNNFLTVLLVDLTQQKTIVNDLIILVGIMRLFEFMHDANYSDILINNNNIRLINTELKTNKKSSAKDLNFDLTIKKDLNNNNNINNINPLVKKHVFYNDSMNNYLSIKAQCVNYFKYLKKKEECNNVYDFKLEAQNFSFVKYYFMYDTGSKKEILSYFNIRAQAQEALSSSLNIIENIFSVSSESMYLIFKINRNNIVEDTLDIIVKNINFRKPLKVKFIGEPGVDEGGVKKEFFMLLTRQLFDPNYGMFTYNQKNHYFWFNIFSFETTLKFELIGILLSLAMYNDVILDILFPKVIYKKLLNVNYSLDDLKDLDEKLYENLKFLQCCDDENLEESLGVSFEVEVNNFGNLESVELKPNGGNILVSQSNKEEYIQLYLNWYFNTSIEKFFKSFYTGFYRVAEKNFLKIIDYEELELIICGTKELDFNSLKDGCLVGDGYEEDSETVKYLWEILLNEYNEDMKKKFLFFLTGCDKSPIKGLSSLNMSIGRYGPDSDKIPCAHTCFNFLLLPDYKDKNKLREKLKIAIENSEGFGLM